MTLLVVSLMTGFALKALQNHTPGKSECYAKTRLQLREIGASLDSYVRSNGAYPKPARVNIGVTGTSFGKSDDGTNLASTGAAAAKVWFGALPFATIGLPASYASDCWGNRFTYAVTDVLTSSATFAANDGALTVRAGNWSAAPTACGSGGNCISSKAAYALASRGENPLVPCQRNYSGLAAGCYCNSQQADSGVTRPDKENCDTNNAVFHASAFNNGPNAPNYFDDLVIYREKAGILNAACLPTDVTWSTNCGGPIGVVPHGSTVIVSNSKAGFSGTASFQCTNGTLAVSAPSCTASCDGTWMGGFCWYLGALNESCDSVCTTHGGYNAGTQTYAGSGGTLANCTAVLNALRGGYGTLISDNASALAYGCVYRTSSDLSFRYTGTPTTSSSASPVFQRTCACAY